MVIELMENCIDAGFEEKTAIDFINTAYINCSGKDSPVTMDMSVVDCQSGMMHCIKLGAVSTFKMCIRDRDYCCDNSPAIIHCTGTCIRSKPGAGYIYSNICWICYFLLRRKQGSDSWTYSSICYNSSWYSCEKWYGWTYSCYNYGRYNTCYYGAS